jgi:hypothetical protein
MKNISLGFPITDEEFVILDKNFTKLCWHAAHDLKKKNSKNNYIDDPEDIKQNLQISMLTAGSYYKRQVYIEKCLILAKKYSKDQFMIKIVEELDKLWNNRKRHGANRQKYGPYQELLLENIVSKIVPKKERPNRNDSLKMDSKFENYCKSVVWNGQKSMGKKITREKNIRSGLVSLSEFDYLQ